MPATIDVMLYAIITALLILFVFVLSIRRELREVHRTFNVRTDELLAATLSLARIEGEQKGRKDSIEEAEVTTLAKAKAKAKVAEAKPTSVKDKPR